MHASQRVFDNPVGGVGENHILLLVMKILFFDWCHFCLKSNPIMQSMSPKAINAIIVELCDSTVTLPIPSSISNLNEEDVKYKYPPTAEITIVITPA